MSRLKLASAVLLGVALAVGAVAVLGASPRPGAGTANVPWHQTAGPEGGWVRQVLYHPTDPEIAYASAGPAGFYRSTDGGRTWQLSTSGLPANASVETLATSPSAPSVLLAVVEQQGVFRSPDTGLTWSVLNPTPFRRIRSLAASPNYATDRIAFLAWEYAPPGGPPEYGVVKLVDTEAVTVAQIMPGSLAMTPNFDDDGPNPDVFLVDYGSDLWNSSNGGDTWTNMGSVLDERRTIVELVVSHGFDTDQTLFLGTGDYLPWNASAGLFKSTDGGQSWTHIGGNLPQEMTILHIALTPDYNDRDPMARTLFVSGAMPGTDFIDHVFRSTDGGQSWKSTIENLPPAGKRESLYLALSPDFPEDHTLLGSNIYGTYRSTDAGDTWTLSTEGVVATQVSSLAAGSTTLFARVRPAGDPYGWYPDLIFRSTDGGRTWVQAAARGFPFTAGEWHLTSGPTLLALPDDLTVYTWGGRGHGIYRSTDAGESWEPVNEGLTVTTSMGVVTATITSVVGHPLSPTLLYAGGGRNVYRSTDGGEHWTVITGSLPSNIYGVADMAIDGRSPETVYLLGNDGRVYGTTDSGEIWADLSGGMPPSTVPKKFLAAHPGRSGWVSTGGGIRAGSEARVYNQLLLTTDGGATWVDLTDNLPPESGVIRKLFVSRSGWIWLLADRLYISTDGGQSWAADDLGLEGVLITYLLPDHRDSIYAATEGRGVWVRPYVLPYQVYLPLLWKSY